MGFFVFLLHWTSKHLNIFVSVLDYTWFWLLLLLSEPWLSDFLVAQFPVCTACKTEEDFWKWLFNSPIFWRAISFSCLLDIPFVNLGIPSWKEVQLSNVQRKQPGCSGLWGGKVWWAVTLLLCGREVTALPSLLAVTEVYSCLWDFGDMVRPFLLNFCVIPNSVNFSNHLRSAPDGVTFCFMGRFESIPFAYSLVNYFITFEMGEHQSQELCWHFGGVCLTS